MVLGELLGVAQRGERALQALLARFREIDLAPLVLVVALAHEQVQVSGERGVEAERSGLVRMDRFADAAGIGKAHDRAGNQLPRGIGHGAAQQARM
jgi:hypothetical protein